MYTKVELHRRVSSITVKTLFSQHFLQHRLPALTEWTEDIRPAFEQVCALYAQARRFGHTWNEAQTEDEFIKPILRLLGWEFFVQTKSRRGGRVNRPDYALFADESAKREAMSWQGKDDAFYSRALAIAEAKYWGRPLSAKDSSGRDAWKKGENPSYQMVSYLIGTRCAWGILTNGMTWRLYSLEVSSVASQFYEVDLSSLFEFLPDGAPPSDEQLARFRRWYLFFRKVAFLPDKAGKSFVRRVLEGSKTYARGVSDKLKDLVFRQVMPVLAGGFLAYRFHEQGIREETPETLAEIYRASLSLLYKLLFLLYAEARALLPIENGNYAQESLTRMAAEIAEKMDRHQAFSGATYATPLYDRLLALFRRVDRGDPALGIPRYNGGLFSPKTPENDFLETHKLSDRVIALAVDTLVRGARQPVDYAFISVRNLGSIYEGLLENRLQVVDAAAGQVELVNDKGERKATGSYYTPDYIVEYIVRKTLTPILDERENVFGEAMARAAKIRKRLARAADHATATRLRGELEQAEGQAREAFLGIKVLDPAMGSGHFLVNAVDFLTDAIIRRMQAFHDAHPDIPWKWNPIQTLIERVRDDILTEMKAQGICLDASRLNDTALLTRLVMKRCIYGVDLNPMAVELAKLSLWLHSFTVGAPLSFLDHHLRCGNSLIGTDVRMVEAAMQVKEQKGGGMQFSLWGGPFSGLLDLTVVMTEIAERTDATLADVRQSADAFDSFRQALAPYKEILDLWVSQHFGNGRALEFLTSYRDDLLDVLQGRRGIPEIYRETLDAARRLAVEKRFFHWDLEFPEVFVDLKRRDWAQNPGFDAVVGNPPYGAILDTFEEKFISKRCPVSTSHDTAEYFLERSDKVVKERGLIGLIVPKSIAFYRNWRGWRKYTVQNHTLTYLLDVGIGFENVNYEQLVLIFQKLLPTKEWCVTVDGAAPLRRFEPLKEINLIGCVKQDLMQMEETLIFCPVSKEEEQCLRTIRAHSIPLAHIALSIFRGLYIRDNLKKTLASGPYKFIDKVPDVGRYEIYRIREIGLNEPRYIQRAQAVMVPRFFFKVLRGKRLVVYPDTLGELLTTEKLVNVVIKPDVRYSLLMITAVVNSRTPSFYLQKILFSGITETSRVMDEEYSSRIPIPRIIFETPPTERACLVKEGDAQTSKVLESPEVCGWDYPTFLRSPMGSWLEERLAASPEQSDVVHDLLSELARKMIAINEQKQAEMKGFLAWFERQLGAKIDDLSGKSQLRRYLGDYQKGEEHLAFEQLLDILSKNQKKLGVKVSSRDFQENLEREYRASLGKLLRLKARLAATDRLIDLIVYRLYGLTEDEVRVVEQA